MRTVYISGHLDLTFEEFLNHYMQQIIDAFRNGDDFVVGDANGADTHAQILLSYLCHKDMSPVTVYHMFTQARNLVGNFRVKGGYTTDTDRDEAMTAASDYDIAWVREGREKSGTAKNIKRRQYR